LRVAATAAKIHDKVAGDRGGTRVVVERHQKDEMPAATGTLVLARERRYGETVVNLYDVGTPSPPEAAER